MKKIYVVIGVMNTGSGSLTYPEDFDTVGFYTNETKAIEHAECLNQENGVYEDEESYEGMVYSVDVIKNLNG